MPRNSVHVRAATPDDLAVLLAFGDELREQLAPVAGGRGGPDSRPGRALSEERAVLEQRYLAAIADPERHLVLCVRAGDEPLGMALLTVAPANALLDLPAVHLSHAVVPGRHRRRGAGKALVAAAVEHAEALGIEQIVVAVNPGSREANRFFARLGFAPLAVRRVAAVPTVRRRLAEVQTPLGGDLRRRPRRVVPARVRPALPHARVQVDP